MNRIFHIIITGLIVHSMNLSAQVKVYQPVKFLALGDSYTIGASVSSDKAWPYQLENSLSEKGYDVEKVSIIATTGWTTSDLKIAINSNNPGNEYNLVSLLIGVNNQYRGGSIDNYEREFEELLNEAIRIAGDKRQVFVLSIPDYGYTPYGKNNQYEISQDIDQFNSVNSRITAKYNVAYVDITELTRLGLQNPEYVASDGLHPSAIMYGLWVEKIMEQLTVIPVNNQEFPDSDHNIRVAVKEKSIYFIHDTDLDLKNTTIQIYDITGKKVYEGKFENEIQLTHLKKGIYLYHIHSPGSKSLNINKFILS